MDSTRKHWVEATGPQGDGYYCEECNYFVKKGMPLSERCPACRKEMSQNVMQLTLLDKENQDESVRN